MWDLELDSPDAYIPDAFDPFAFGSDGDDSGIALTLTAMLKVVHQIPEASESPAWWTDAIRGLVKELENADSEEAITSDEGLDNRFGLVPPPRTNTSSAVDNGP